MYNPFFKIIFTVLLSIFFSNSIAQALPKMKHDSLYTQINNAINYTTYNNLNTVLKQIDVLPKYAQKKAQWQILAGDIFNKNNQLNKAFHYYKKAYRINQYNNDSVALMRDHINIGVIFQKKIEKNYDSLYTNASLQLKDSVLHYYNKNIQQYQRVTKGAPYIASAYSNLAYILSDYEQYKKSDLYINKALAINKTLYNENHPVLIATLNNKALFYIYQEKYLKAIALEKLVLQKATDTSNIKVLDTKNTALLNISYAYEGQNNYKKALKYMLLSIDVTTIIQQKQKAIETRTIEAKYNVAKATQQAKLALLKTKEKQKRTQNYAIIGGLAAISILLFITILYRNEKIKRRNASLTLTKQKLNQEKILRAVTEENQNNIINATLDGREKERHEIALTLHDSFGSLFTAVNMHLQVFKVKNNITSNEIEKAQNMISEAAEKARNLSHKLISTNLIKYGLEHTFDDMCEKYSNSQISFELESENLIPRFNDTFERRIHNIVEECMNNILKHSKANEVNITMIYKNSILHTSITDNGIGFNTNKTNPNAGIGLGQIKARINSMQGEYNIKSILNEGTKISLDVPIAIRTQEF
jgi:signal transduction histidine kinase